MADEKKVEEKDISFTGVRDKFNEASGDVRGDIEEYNGYVAEMEKAIDVLDGYDDFSSLKIAASAYESRGDGTYGYGIEKKRTLHGSGAFADVILDHQKKAAQMFLENLRGFGLLADVVGSGKTFEAGVVLSELTYRGKVGTLLIVAISEVMASWEDVICKKFGLGSTLVVIKKENEGFSVRKDGVTEALSSGFKWSDCIEVNGRRPTRPILVDLEVFKHLSMDRTFSSGCIFDMIIVDEAHELCNEKNIAAMGLLSDMIQKKRLDGTGNECYCLLLSATPHDGNLKGMFPLWYFICRRGGDPGEFFHGTSEQHSAEYNSEFDHYSKDICFGADNISDFVMLKKIYDFQPLNVNVGMRRAFEKYFNNFGPSIKEENGISTIKEFDEANTFTKERVINDFLGIRNRYEKDRKNLAPKLSPEERKERRMNRDREDASVASAYRNLLNLIMIRQNSETGWNSSSRRKKTVNLYFYPVKPGALKGGVIGGLRMDGDIALDYGKVFSSFPEVYYPELLRKDSRGGTRGSLFGSIGDYTPRAFYAEILKGLFGRFVEDEYRVDGISGFKNGYESYYYDMLRDFDDTIGNSDADKSVYEAAPTGFAGQFNLLMPYEFRSKEDMFGVKFDYLMKILDSNKHQGSRIIIFFDYGRATNNAVTRIDGTVEESYYDKFERELRARLHERKIIAIEASGGDTDEKIAEFDDDENAGCVLVVKGGFTHGANLQKASVIVNFQVSCDPVDMEQKIGRIFRLGQRSDVTVYSLADMNDLEGYALAYFTRIGLFAVNNGDATILSGCNDSEMVTIRCSECNNVTIMSKNEYDTYRQALNLTTGSGKAACVSRINIKAKKMYVTPLNSAGGLSDEEEEVPYSEEVAKRGSGIMCGFENSHAKRDRLLMSPINNGEFVCSVDKTHKFLRGKGEGDEGYKCMDAAGQIMCSTGGKGNRTYFCNKLCVISHCRLFRQAFPNCGAKKAFAAGDPYSACVDKCLDDGTGKRCEYYEKCLNGVKGSRCMPESDSASMAQSIDECIDCVEWNRDVGKGFGCAPGPHTLTFDEEWSGAECPICRAKGAKEIGKLEKVPMRTFSEHIGYLWDIDRSGSSCFCNILEDEAENVGDIERILKESGKGGN
ncbi:MAG: hypothetical protein LUD29_06460 [Clostridia bacterium]|nr:hypothetical protein [Clostridia bacterium]